MPGYSGLFELSEERDLIVPDEFENRHGLRLWLVLLIEHFLAPLGYVLNGEVSWTADEADDRGTIFVKNNTVECVDDLFVNQGPSWSPKHYCDHWLKIVIRKLIDSADSAGCSPDLTVVSSTVVDSLREVFRAFDVLISNLTTHSRRRLCFFACRQCQTSSRESAKKENQE